MNGRAAGLRNWTVSLAATVASSYALDACAAAAGVALVASGLLAGLDQPWLLLFLAASYAAWAVGLRANLRANWTLLVTTGTSTNVLSKAAYDLARRTSSNTGVLRLAAAIGYAGTQVVAEGFYYAGAFGAAAFSDSVTGTEALGFLAGANLAAALYEYGLARITAGFLRRRRRYASFDTDWVPAEYLAGYYRGVEPDEVATVAFLVDAMRHAEADQPVLFFGVGPTCTTCSQRPKPHPRSTWATTYRPTWPRSGGGSAANRVPTTGVRSSATPCSARAPAARPTRRSPHARTSPERRSPNWSRSTPGTPARSSVATRR